MRSVMWLQLRVICSRRDTKRCKAQKATTKSLLVILSAEYLILGDPGRSADPIPVLRDLGAASTLLTAY
jgi:hypothetical protein